MDDHELYAHYVYIVITKKLLIFVKKKKYYTFNNLEHIKLKLHI